ncbi:hypothetical protein [Streptomyces sp. NPDC012825]|uniref:hypothetical protein n=1 Tax=Streptomyces sp. NPDC012825 TaxID=3364851 RepID=UPI0036A238D5
MKPTPSRRAPAPDQYSKAAAVDSTVLEDQDVAYEVELRFRPDGPAVLGVWSKPETADQKFVERLGAYSRPGTVLALTATADGTTQPVKSWTYEGGLRVAEVA